MPKRAILCCFLMVCLYLLNFLENPLSENPDRLAGIFPRKGAIQIGSDADFTVVDMNAEKTMKEEDVISKEDFTPWEGYTAKGIPVYTVVRGKLVMDNGKIVGQMGYGEYIPASHGK